MSKIQLKSFLRGSAVSMIGVGTMGIMNYLIRRTLALNLPETEYGFFYSAFALMMLVMVFLDLGLTQSTIILMSKSFTKKSLEESKKIFTLTFMTKTTLAIIFLITMELLAPSLNKYYFKYSDSYLMLMLVFLIIPGQTVEAALGSVISAKKAFGTQQLLYNLKTFLILSGIVIFVPNYGLKAAILCFIIPSVITIGISFKVIKNYGISFFPLKSICPDNFKKIFSLSSCLAISTAGMSIMYYMDTVCLTWLLDLKSVAMYNIALPIMQIAQGFFVFPAIFTPFVSEMWQKKDYKRIKHSCLVANSLMLLTLPVFLFGGIYFSQYIIGLLFDTKYASAAPAVTVLWCGMVFFSIASFNMNALNSGGKQKNTTILVIFCLVVNFVLNVILIPQFNYTGAALATAITYFIMALGATFYLLITVNVKIRDYKKTVFEQKK